MAQLREIRVSETPLTFSNKRDWFFHQSAHHVRELLLHFLPSGFVLDGSSLVTVIFGKKRDSDLQWQQIPVLGITFYYFEDFDIPAYMALPPDDQQECVLSAVTAVLIKIAVHAGSDPAPDRPCRQVRSRLPLRPPHTGAKIMALHHRPPVSDRGVPLLRHVDRRSLGSTRVQQVACLAGRRLSDATVQLPRSNDAF